MTCCGLLSLSLPGDKSFELQVAEDRHKEEVCVLKRLQWYAENQELLDRDSARLRAATADTHKLTEQVGPNSTLFESVYCITVISCRSVF